MSELAIAFLKATNGPDAGKEYPLVDGPCLLGRHPDCQVVIEVGAVSRHHAQIEQDGDGFVIRDLNSRNHTFVNGEQVEAHRLSHGDRIRVCDIEFLYYKDRSPIPAPDGSKIGVFVEEDSQSSSSTIMSKIGVSSSRGQLQLTASPQAKLDALQEIAKNLGKALSLDEVLPKVLNSLFKIFHQADRGFIALKGEDGTLVPRWTKARRDDTEDTIRISRTIVSQVMESQEAILSADAATDERFEMSQSIADFRIRSMMCAPLIDSENNSMGVLQIDTLEQRKRFQPEDLEVLLAVASQAGVSIDNAKMHERAVMLAAFERDLELAHEVQRGFLPVSRPDFADLTFYDFYRPANHVGGDYFDYVMLPNGQMAVLVADVVGHGVAAALLMAKLSAEARFSLVSEPNPAAAVTRLNDHLSHLQIDRFVTLIVAIINPATHEVTIVNAGHMAPIHRKVDGTIEEPGAEQSGLPLGIAEGIQYEQVTVTLQPGESMTLFTDGVNEAANKAGKQFEIPAIRKIVAAQSDPEKIGDTIVTKVRAFMGDAAQEDDMCVVVFGR